ncbi:MAG: hypothetical protein COB76_01345 [Alphaproteobacteria bacterium]|nr:MAG: hypothetical protein COB76_01345 [Alphaproteobacteria bacterium]
MNKSIVLNFSAPPSNEDIQSLAESLCDSLPNELSAVCEGLKIIVDHFPPQETMDEFELDTDFDLLALYRDTAEKIPGVPLKGVRSEKTLTLYRRPILDVWCETEDDLEGLVRHLMITELAQHCGYGAEDIEKLANG